MATPVVAGIAGLLISERTGGFWGRISTRDRLSIVGEVQVEKKVGLNVIAVGDRISSELALILSPEPNLALESYIIDDASGDGDGIPDAGETVISTSPSTIPTVTLSM